MEQGTCKKYTIQACFCSSGKALVAVGLLFLLQIPVYYHLMQKKVSQNRSHGKYTADATNVISRSGNKWKTSTKNISHLEESIVQLMSVRMEKKPVKVILYWNTFFGQKDWYHGMGRKPFGSCEYKNCITTNDKKVFEESDAMLCHMRSPGCGIHELPKHRTPNQYWAYFLAESPVNSNSDDLLTPYNGIFNLTITYKLDSNITNTYSEKNKIIQLLKDKSHQFYKGSTTSVAWISSNCVGAPLRGRIAYISELSKHISVTRYGGCPGHTQCGDTCYKDVAKKHKFYFAAENSICKDYVTEKPWRALEVGMIPIVYGYGNYSRILPTHSYIDVNDFKSPRLLANYLKKVSDNETLYNVYFKWRDTYIQSAPKVSYMCRLCQLLNQAEPPHSVIYNLDKFWSETNDCVNPDIFHESVMQTPSAV